MVSRYNESITGKLLAGALETLARHGVADDAIDVAWVPGAFEIPLVADRLADSGRYAAVICLGAVIRGETTHDQHINRAVSLGLAEVGVRSRRAGLVRSADLRYARTGDPPLRRQRRQQGQRVRRWPPLEMIDLLGQAAALVRTSTFADHAHARVPSLLSSMARRSRAEKSRCKSSIRTT